MSFSLSLSRTAALPSLFKPTCNSGSSKSNNKKGKKKNIYGRSLCPPPPSTRQTETLHHHEWLYILGFEELLLLVLLRITFNIAVKFECIKNTQVFFLCFVSSFLFFCDPPDPDPIFFTSHTTSKGSDQSWRSGGGGGGGSSGNRSNSNA